MNESESAIARQPVMERTGNRIAPHTHHFVRNSSFLRPVRASETRSLFQGIDYRREVRSLPRPIVIHIVTIDLTAPGVRAFVTPGSAAFDGTETNAQITSKFLSEFNLKLAINANFFYRFREETPWDYFPHVGNFHAIRHQAFEFSHSK